jgi:hypothetical protein
MSIESLVDTFGKVYYIIRPTVAKQSDGQFSRTYDSVVNISGSKGFYQPSGTSQDVFEGRQNTRTAGTVYFKGSLDIRIDDELRETSFIATTSPVLRVVGAVNPGNLGNVTIYNSHLNMTVVEVVEVLPKDVLEGGLE